MTSLTNVSLRGSNGVRCVELINTSDVDVSKLTVGADLYYTQATSGLIQHVTSEVALTAETERATAAETALSVALDMESSRAFAAESGLNTALGMELTARTAADASNAAAIVTETTRATAAEAAIVTNGVLTNTTLVGNTCIRTVGTNSIITAILIGLYPIPGIDGIPPEAPRQAGYATITLDRAYEGIATPAALVVLTLTYVTDHYKVKLAEGIVGWTVNSFVLA